MEDMALELEEQRLHDAKMARLEKEKRERDDLVRVLALLVREVESEIGVVPEPERARTPLDDVVLAAREVLSAAKGGAQ